MSGRGEEKPIAFLGEAGRDSEAHGNHGSGRVQAGNGSGVPFDEAETSEEPTVGDTCYLSPVAVFGFFER
jgi:hypothetical protein